MASPALSFISVNEAKMVLIQLPEQKQVYGSQ